MILREKVLMWLAIAAITVGIFYGAKGSENITLLLAIPWWGVVGAFLPMLIVKNPDANTVPVGAMCAYIILNVTLLLFYQSQDFVIGRLIGIIGAVIIIILLIQYPPGIDKH